MIQLERISYGVVYVPICLLYILYIEMLSLIFVSCGKSLDVSQEYSDETTIEITENTIDGIDILGYMSYGKNDYSTKYEKSGEAKMET